MKRLLMAGAAVTLAASGICAQEHRHVPETTEKLGKVSFAISCAGGAQSEFERGVALLHSFWYEEAEKSFRQIAARDASCAMAYWGQAMSIYRPLWVRLTDADLKRGQELMREAEAAGAKTQRERDYIAALGLLYQANQKTEYHERTVAYCD